MTLKGVLKCPTNICGHAFILAMMLTYGTDFTPHDLRAAPAQSTNAEIAKPLAESMYPINV